MKKRNFIVIVVVVAALIFPIRQAAINLFAEKSEPILADKIDDGEDLDTNVNIDDIPLYDNNIEEVEDMTDYLLDTTFVDDSGKLILKNTDDILVLVNKRRNLPSDYKPSDLVIPDVKFSFDDIIDKRHLRKEAAHALEDMFREADNQNVILYGVSGYRSYNTQNYLFENKVSKVGEEEANLLVARPGQSEHQTGLAMDISSKSANFSLIEDFGQTTEGQWVNENAHRFGFIIRYKRDTTDITGYSFEPWHIRYVGVEVATEIYERNITLEEFLGDA
ncbi:MAG: M15 family metallopeptidase [Tissierellaceae bacterium]|nr:M15 family metallopeptidase [Tissierellaceae bacterium]